MVPLGLYLHIPFCRSKCLYCDFCSVPTRDTRRMEVYADRLCRDIAAHATRDRGYCVDSIYLGGGTPTALPAELLVRILECVHASHRVVPHAEITAECNPSLADADTFRALRGAGVNRLSIGLQSAHAQELRALGRTHSFADFEAAVARAREAGFSNISVDLMFGIPTQTPESFLQTLERVIALAPTHISAYGLTLEPGTAFERLQNAGRLQLPDEEATREMYFSGIRRLAAAGYAQYEISNFAKIGYESVHNLKYWSCDEYLGLGPAAYSDFGGARFGNSRDLDAYIAGEDILQEHEIPTPKSRWNEYLMLRLRLCRGVNIAECRRRFGIDPTQVLGSRLEPYLRAGLMEWLDGTLRLTPAGFYVSNAILADLLDFSE